EAAYGLEACLGCRRVLLRPRLPYPVSPLPRYTTVPAAAACTGSPSLPASSKPRRSFAVEKPCNTLPGTGQRHATSLVIGGLEGGVASATRWLATVGLLAVLGAVVGLLAVLSPSVGRVVRVLCLGCAGFVAGGVVAGRLATAVVRRFF